MFRHLARLITSKEQDSTVGSQSQARAERVQNTSNVFKSCLFSFQILQELQHCPVEDIIVLEAVAAVQVAEQAA